MLLPALSIGAHDVLVPLRLDDLGAGGLTIGALFVAAAAVEGLLNPVMGRQSDRARAAAADPHRAGGHGRDRADPAAAHRRLAARRAAAGGGGLAGVLLGAGGGDALRSSESLGLDQGFAFGIMNLAWAAGQVGGGAAGGALADLTSDAVPYAILSLLCAATLVLARERSPSPRRR